MLAARDLPTPVAVEQRDDRLPLPSEDEGDLAGEPATGMTDDPIVATEEGVPWDPPTDRVVSEARDAEGVDVAGTATTDAGELEREDDIQADEGVAPRDDALRADVIEVLRASDVSAGDRLRIAVTGSQVHVSGQVESVDVLDEILGIVGDVPGVTDVVDDVDVEGV
jgi:osmotically-inducible protein OsmY